MSPLRRGRVQTLWACAGVYAVASLIHFFHNAEFCSAYPNLPEWISRWSVYASWIAITGVGVVGFFLLQCKRPVIGLAFVGVYAVLGFDGLGHYALAPMARHSRAMNLTIWGEVMAAALLLAVVARSLVTELRTIWRRA